MEIILCFVPQCVRYRNMVSSLVIACTCLGTPVGHPPRVGRDRQPRAPRGNYVCLVAYEKGAGLARWVE